MSDPWTQRLHAIEARLDSIESRLGHFTAGNVEERLDSLDGKLDGLLAFRDWLQGKVEDLVGTGEATLGSMAMAAVNSVFAKPKAGAGDHR